MFTETVEVMRKSGVAQSVSKIPRHNNLEELEAGKTKGKHTVLIRKLRDPTLAGNDQ